MPDLIIVHPLCPQCGYSLTGLPDDHACPECGFHYQFEALKQLVRHEYWKRLTRSQDVIFYSWIAAALCLPLAGLADSRGRSLNGLIAILALVRAGYLLLNSVTGMQPVVRELMLPACMALGLAFFGLGAPDITVLILFAVWGFSIALFVGQKPRLPYLQQLMPLGDARHLEIWAYAARASMMVGTLALPLAIYLALRR